jgi:hypothetical protein
MEEAGSALSSSATNIPGVGRSFATKLDFVRPEHTDLRGRAFNPAGRTLPEKQRLRERVFVSQPCIVEDAREAPGGIGSFDLDTNGFAYMRGLLPPWPPNLANPLDYDFPDWEAAVLPGSLEYLPALAEACRKFVGAEAAYVTNYILRSDAVSEGPGYNVHTHSDFGPWAVETFRAMLSERYGVPPHVVRDKELLLVNCWHPFDRPAYSDPLALMDMSSLNLEPGWEETSALRRLPIAIDSLSSLGDNDEPSAFYRSGRFYSLGADGQQTLRSDDGLLSACPPAETHKFYFCPDMEPDECWLFKQWDTRTDKGARVCFHSAVHDPFYDADGTGSISGLEGRLRSHTVSRMPTRRSLECRLVMTFPSVKASTSKL